MKQYGGMKLKNPSKSKFSAMYDMMTSPNHRLKILTTTSLTGFILTLDVDPEHSEYLGLKGKRFTEVVTSYILKIAVITPENGKIPDFKGRIKGSESEDSYFEEAKLQQQCWLKSISGGRPAICPSVANFSFFTNDDSKKLLRSVRDAENVTMEEVFTYLMGCMEDENNQLGVITMSKVPNSNTLADFMAMLTASDKTADREAYAHAIAQIVRLFVEIGVIHFDLHMGNILVYRENGIHTRVIDFGRASDITSNLDDNILSIEEKVTIQEKMDEYKSELNKPRSPSEKYEYIKKILKYLEALDLSYMHRYGRQHAQMSWYKNYPYHQDTVPNDVYSYAYDLFRAMTTYRRGVTPTTLRTHLSSDQLANLTTPKSVPFPGKPCKTEWCGIMGGTRKRRKRKYTRK